MIEVLNKSCLFLNNKKDLQRRIDNLIYQSEFTGKRDNNFLINIKKRNNSILGFHP